MNRMAKRDRECIMGKRKLILRMMIRIDEILSK